MRQPTFYITHGGGPCFWMEFPPPFGPLAYNGLKQFFSSLLASLPDKPKAVLLVTAHWEEAVPTISTNPGPGMLYDYYGFPEHTYHLQYPAPGAPDVAQRVQTLMTAAGLPTATNPDRGFDHGVFVPMMIIDHSATLPVAMMSLKAGLNAEEHLAIGQALTPLRDEGVVIIGSGSSYHNMRHIFDGTEHASVAFDQWLTDTATEHSGEERQQRLQDWKQAPGGRESHPRPEHLIPLMVASGAAHADLGKKVFGEKIGGKAYSCFAFG